MSRGVNKAIIVGNLGAAPEIRYTAGGNAVANISVATSDQWKDKQGKDQERTEWHKVVMFKRMAEVCGEYATKGMKVYIEGKIKTRKWQNKDGVDQYTTEIVAYEFQMLGGGEDAAPRSGQQGKRQPSNQQGQRNQYRDQKQGTRAGGYPQSHGPGNGQQGGSSGAPGFDDDLDDDIPFSQAGPWFV